jgi:hypothetical protein
MKRCILGLALSALAIGPALAGTPTGTYPNGVEGLGAASLPPPGIYWRNYEVFYGSNQLRSMTGATEPVGLGLGMTATINRVIWISPYKVLGGNFGCDVVIPVVNTTLHTATPASNSTDFGLYDILFGPAILAWHGKNYDSAAAMCFFAPTGRYRPSDPTSTGKGCWTLIPTAGYTYYFDQHRSLSVSVLGRYEWHTQNSAKVTTGENLDLEWGVGKQIGTHSKKTDAVWDVGVAGYYTLQTTDDTGSGVTWDRSQHNQAVAIGPEAKVMFHGIGTIFSLRTEWEFDCLGRTQGTFTTLTTTKMF